MKQLLTCPEEILVCDNCGQSKYFPKAGKCIVCDSDKFLKRRSLSIQQRQSYREQALLTGDSD